MSAKVTVTFSPSRADPPDRHTGIALQDGVALKERVEFVRNPRYRDSEKQYTNCSDLCFHVLKFAPRNSIMQNQSRPLFDGSGVRDVCKLGDRLRARANMQLFVNAADVRVDRWHADVQRLGNFLVEIAAGEQFEHFALARRKTVRLGG